MWTLQTQGRNERSRPGIVGRAGREAPGVWQDGAGLGDQAPAAEREVPGPEWEAPGVWREVPGARPRQSAWIERAVPGRAPGTARARHAPVAARDLDPGDAREDRVPLTTSAGAGGDAAPAAGPARLAPDAAPGRDFALTRGSGPRHVPGHGAPATGRTASRDVVGPRADVVLVGASNEVQRAVEEALLAAGRTLEVRPSHGGREIDPGQHLLVSVEEPSPPPGALLVGLDGRDSWTRASRSPLAPLVTLPSGAAWLGARLTGGGTRGEVVAVAHLGEAAPSYRVGLALAEAAAERGLSVVLADADGLSSRRFAAGARDETGAPEGSWRVRPAAAVRSGRSTRWARSAGLVGSARAARSARSGKTIQGQRSWIGDCRGAPGVGWGAAVRWAADGSVAGLPGLLPRVGGVAHLGWAHGEDPGELTEEAVDSVLEALSLSHDLVVLVAGAARWPRAHVWPHAGTLIVAHAGAQPWPEHDCPVGVRVLLACARGGATGRWCTADGPETAARLRAQWIGSARDGRGDEPSAAQRRQARRLWLPAILSAGPDAVLGAGPFADPGAGRNAGPESDPVRRRRA